MSRLRVWMLTCASATSTPQLILRLMSHTDGSEAVCPVMGARPVAGYTPKPNDPSLVNGGEGTVAPGTLIGQLPPGHPPIPQPNTPYRTDTPQLDPRLSTVVVASNIPRGGVEGEEFWQYPSPQRFFNAMQRKGYNPEAEEMQAVVSIHNTVNERAWREVMEYERYHLAECPLPKLLRFRGRPKDFSIKSRILSFMGYAKPFDRHDWIVDRCGTEQRYILDFYSGPDSPDPNAPVSVHLDVRPDLTFSGIKDRMRKSYDDFALRTLGPDYLSAPMLPLGPLRPSTGKENFTPPAPPKPL